MQFKIPQGKIWPTLGHLGSGLCLVVELVEMIPSASLANFLVMPSVPNVWCLQNHSFNGSESIWCSGRNVHGLPVVPRSLLTCGVVLWTDLLQKTNRSPSKTPSKIPQRCAKSSSENCARFFLKFVHGCDKSFFQSTPQTFVFDVCAFLLPSAAEGFALPSPLAP